MQCGISQPCFRRAYCLNFQGQKESQARNQQEASTQKPDTMVPTQQQQKSTNKGCSTQEQIINTHGTPTAKLH
jgi:hypothetical protein